MKRSSPEKSRSDRVGMLIAALCFVHCVAGPVLLTFAGLASLIGISERLEPAFLLSSAALGTIALIPGYRTKHGRLSCLAMFCAGLLCLIVRRHLPWRAVPIEPAATAAGAILIVAAHVLNMSFSRRCPCCEPASESNVAESGEALGQDDRDLG
jgi:hypothetical protein